MPEWVLFLVVAGCGDGVSGSTLVACKVSAKSNGWESQTCLIHTSRKVQSFVEFSQFVRVARGREDSMCLHGFCFWWLPVVGMVCLGVRWWHAKFQRNLTIGGPKNV